MIKLDDLRGQLSVRAINCLKMRGYEYLEEVDNEAIRRVTGKKTKQEILEFLQANKMVQPIFLGAKYWNDIVIDDIISNDFNFNKEVIKSIIKVEPICKCGNYGRQITFEHKGKLYSFNYLTGYPCQC